MFKARYGLAALLLLTCLVIACIAAPAAYAAQPYTVHGYVRDSSGNPVGGASVSIGGLGLSTSTSGSGYYQISGNNFETGSSYTVSASKSGYDSGSGGFTVNGGDSGVDLRLSARVAPSGTPNPGEQPPDVPSGDNVIGGTTVDMSAFYIRVTEYPSATPVPATPTPEPTVEATPVPATPTPVIEAAVTPTPTPVPTTTVQTSPDLTWLLFLLLLLIAFILGYLTGRKHEQMNNDREAKKKQ